MKLLMLILLESSNELNYIVSIRNVKVNLNNCRGNKIRRTRKKLHSLLSLLKDEKNGTETKQI